MATTTPITPTKLPKPTFLTNPRPRSGTDVNTIFYQEKLCKLQNEEATLTRRLMGSGRAAGARVIQRELDMWDRLEEMRRQIQSVRARLYLNM